MDSLLERCAGLDVHKASVMACIKRIDKSGRCRQEVKQFGTTTPEILELSDWMARRGVTHVAMESTGVYWKPIWNLLEGRFALMLVNAQHIKRVPGRKTDVADCEWIAQLLQHGLLEASFVPERPLRELRDLTRQRAQIVGERTRVIHRIDKVLQDANIKLSSVATQTLGVSGRAILAALLQGEPSAEQLAELARGRLRSKLPELRKALCGHLTEHHRFMLEMHLGHLAHLEGQIEELSARVEQAMKRSDADSPPQGPGAELLQGEARAELPQEPSSSAAEPPPSEPQAQGSAPPALEPLGFEAAVELLDTIPGVDQRSAQNIIAELGTDMQRFGSAQHLASWVGICSGNNESAGKSKNAKTRKANRWMRRSLGQAAWAAARVKNSYLSAQFRRLAARRGKQRAIIAVAHSIVVSIYHMLKKHRPYQDLGADYFNNRLDPQRMTRSLVKRLEKLGHVVTLQPRTEAA